MTWTKRLEQFALSCKLRQSDERLLRWLLRKAKRDRVDEIEMDLRLFNKFIERDRGRPYDRKTAKTALWRLDELTQGMVLVTKSYTWAIHKVIIRPLEIVLKQNSQTGDCSPRLDRGNPMFSNAHKKKLDKQQQQEISKLDLLLSKVGLKYTHDNLLKLWRLAGKSWSEIESAIEHMLRANVEQVEGVTKPHGWLVSSLMYGWHRIAPEPVNLPHYSEFDGIMQLVRDCSRSRCQT